MATDGTIATERVSAYEAPALTVWGSVAELTAGPTNVGANDLPLAGHRMS